MRKRYLFLITLLLAALQIRAQAPGGVPYGQPDPLEFNLVNVIVFIIIPVIIIWLYIGFKRKNRKK